MFPNSADPAVKFLTALQGNRRASEMLLPMFLGETEECNEIWMDMTKNPHLLIAGSTGSGKSSLLQVLIANALLNSNSQIFILDTKGIEFQEYENTGRVQILDNYRDAKDLIACLIHEMEYRYILLRMKKLGFQVEMPRILCIIDEYADLILQDTNKQFYHSLLQLTQKCRAANIYCALATQRPSADILKPSIKANFPARIACQVASIHDSRIILDSRGAEKLQGRGESLIRNYNYDLVKFQAGWIKPEHVLGELSRRANFPHPHCEDVRISRLEQK